MKDRHNINKAKGYIEDGFNEVRNRAMSTQAKSWEIVITADDVKVYRVDSVTQAGGGSSDVLTDIQGNKLPKNVSISLKQSNSPTEYLISNSSTGYDSINISFPAEPCSR